MSTVYRITNQINGAICVGSSQLSIEDRWNELVEFANDRELAKTTMPCMRILVMIKRYGAENFHIDSLVEGIYTSEQLEKLEQIEIRKLVEQGNTIYHKTGTYTTTGEVIDRFCSMDEDDDYFHI